MDCLHVQTNHLSELEQYPIRFAYRVSLFPLPMLQASRELTGSIGVSMKTPKPDLFATPTPDGDVPRPVSLSLNLGPRRRPSAPPSSCAEQELRQIFAAQAAEARNSTEQQQLVNRFKEAMASPLFRCARNN